MRPASAFLIVAACGGAAPAPSTKPAAPAVAPSAHAPCASGEHLRDFDFWLGRWAVSGKDGAVVGHNVITSADGGCAVMEAWTAQSGNTGGSINFYDPARKKWREIWVDAGHDIVELEGGVSAGAMVMEGQQTGPDGAITRMRGTWTPNPDGSVRQVFESSADGGKTWTVAFEGHYVKE